MSGCVHHPSVLDHGDAGSSHSPQRETEEHARFSAMSAHSPQQSPSAAQLSGPANRLIHEKSPYLLQHAYNPVDWYPWGDEAFATATREDKPIFLSIGYSTCHWCHVMEHESFENPEIAQLLNQWFVCIKVDREEHPDLDQVYMQAVTMLTGHGGWPLTVFLTPERKPFFGGTYFPPQRRWDMAGMKEMLPAVAQSWKTKREQLVTSAEQLTASLNEQLAQAAPRQAVTPELLQRAFNQAAAMFDPTNGGFGEAPKFPRSHELSFLLRFWARTHTAQALEMVTSTLDHLARGGIHDQLGGGFHRYSTDAHWLVPHFEKMLYDQALLALTYLEAYRITRRQDYADVARGIFEYVLRDLTDPQGAFYSAEDADSEGEEGKFYVWTPAEMTQVLGRDEAELFNRFYSVTVDGNFEHGTSILYVEQPLDVFAKLNGLSVEQLSQRLAASRTKLLAARSARIRPHRDDKILTSWNGLMIAALAEGASTLDEPRYLHAAQRAADFLLTHLKRDASLLRRYRDGDARYPGTLEDYAFFSYGLFELYEASYEPRWLGEAASLTHEMVMRFWDEAHGGFFLRDKEEAPLIVRSKEIYDGATPSGNSIAALVLLKLGRLTANGRLEELGRQAIECAAHTVDASPFGYPQLLSAVDVALGPTQEIVIAADLSDPRVVPLLHAVHQRFLPRVVMVVHPSSGVREAIETLVPYVKTQDAIGGKPTAYVCENYVCNLPTTDPAAFVKLLERPASAQDSR